MKTIPLLLCIIMLAKVSVQAQRPEDWLNSWSARSPIEKIYLHTDRENYLAGETVWFKAYLYSDYQPDTISTSLYVELSDNNSDIIIRKVLPVFLGNTNGQIELPDSLMAGNYIIRAYTLTMMNQAPAFLYKKAIFIYGKKSNTTTSASEQDKKIRLEFFPEGGNLISGFTNTVAFKATGKEGLPVDIKGSLKSDKGVIIASFNSYHDGMGMFEITPAVGEKYYVETETDTSHQKYYLPEQINKGIAVTIIPHPQGNYFEVKQKNTDPAFMVAYMIGQMQHHVVFKQQFSGGQTQLQGVINTKELNSGILQVTFFNKDDMPLAERLCFVNNKEYIQPAELFLDTLDFHSRSKNHFSIILKDTIQGSLSVSVADADLLSSPVRSESILSSFLLTSDLNGYIHNPAYYFSGDNDSVKTALDLLMMTNGWRRFKWAELATLSLPLNKDNHHITLAGKITVRGSKKPFADKQVLLMVMGTIRKRSSHFLQTDKDGKFSIDALLFFDKNRLLFTDIRGKKSQYIDVYLNSDSLHRNFVLPRVAAIPFRNATGNYLSRWQMDYDAILKAEGIMLEGITVKAHKKTPQEELEERYTSGLFSGNANHTIDLVNAAEVPNFEAIQKILSGLN